MSQNYRKELAIQLKKIRKQKGITQQTMSGALHISRSCLANYEVGNRTPDMDILCKMMQYLDADPNTLLHTETDTNVWKS